jgi:hypothetical protein
MQDWVAAEGPPRVYNMHDNKPVTGESYDVAEVARFVQKRQRK